MLAGYSKLVIMILAIAIFWLDLHDQHFQTLALHIDEARCQFFLECRDLPIVTAINIPVLIHLLYLGRQVKHSSSPLILLNIISEIRARLLLGG